MRVSQALKSLAPGSRKLFSDLGHIPTRIVSKLALAARPQDFHYAYLPTLIILMTAVTVTIGVVTLHTIERRLIASAGETLALAADHIAEKLDARLYAEYERIEDTASIMGLMWSDKTAMKGFLEDRRGHSEGSLWVSVADPKGHILASTNDHITSDDFIEHIRYQEQLQASGVYVRESHIQEGTSITKTVAFSAAVRDRQDQILGVVTNHIGLLRLDTVFGETARLLRLQHQNWTMIEWQFLNRNGDVLMDSILRQEGKINLKLMGLPSAMFTGSTEPGYVEETHLRRSVPIVSGYAQTRGYGRFTGLHWGILFRLDRSEVLKETRAVLWKLAAAEAVMFVPMLILLVWTAHRLRNEWMRERQGRERATAAEAAVRYQEAAVRREKEFSERLINSSIDGIIAFDRECRYTLWNRGMECISGIGKGSVIGKCAFDVFPFLKEIGEDEYFREALAGKSVVAKDRPYYVPQTDKRGYFEAYYAPVFNTDGEVEGALAIVRDTTVRKQAETAVRESEERFRLIFNHAKDAILLTDVKGIIFWANREAERLTARPLTALLGKSMKRFFAKQEEISGDEEISLSAHAEGTREYVVLRPDGATVTVETNTTSVSFSDQVFGRIVIARDITERLRMEQKLRQADKLAALGTLLGGVAHELKNPLFIISGNIQIAKQLLPEMGNIIQKNLEAIEEATHRASCIIERFLKVMRSKEHHRKQCQVNDVITSTLELVRHSMAQYHIDVHLELMPELPALVSDPEGLGQVFLNLFANACQALASIEGKRTLRISTKLIATSAGPGVESRVMDNGPGIHPEHVSSVFDPFFTTKPVGQGTGLGLSISHRIITELGGSLRCESTVGQGAMFIVWLPTNNRAGDEIRLHESRKDLHGANSPH
jgi:PAS domain S-box-containing protein